MGALHSVPFCSRTAADDNNNLGNTPEIGQWMINNLITAEMPVIEIVNKLVYRLFHLVMFFKKIF